MGQRKKRKIFNRIRQKLHIKFKAENEKKQISKVITFNNSSLKKKKNFVVKETIQILNIVLKNYNIL